MLDGRWSRQLEQRHKGVLVDHAFLIIKNAALSPRRRPLGYRLYAVIADSLLRSTRFPVDR